MFTTIQPSRRHVLQLAALSGAAVIAGSTSTAQAAISRRSLLHLTPGAGWACDPQRPYYLNGVLQLPHLQADQTAGPGGWRLATSRDEVSFDDAGDMIPLESGFPAWSGSAVVDEANTAGFGAGAIAALVTRLPDENPLWQAQYLHWSTDGGRTFQMLPDPVIANPDAGSAHTVQEIDNASWFRDPKIVRDEKHGQWVCVIGRCRYLSIYVSQNLRSWRWVSNFDYLGTDSPNLNLGGMECPDLFEIQADDGTSHWVMAASMDGWAVGSLGTYAYWVGTWDGERFETDNLVPQWLDYGYDWYAAVTWPSPDQPATVRHAIAWLNNWKYANRHVPTLNSDGYNGQYSIVREVRLVRSDGGWYSLVSTPLPAVRSRLPRVRHIGTRYVNGHSVIDHSEQAFELEVDIDWNESTNVGIEFVRSADGTRHTNVGVYNGRIYVDRGPSELSGVPFSPYTQAEAPIDPNARHVHLRVIVDRGSIEVFVNAGFTVLSNQLYLQEGDTGLALYSDGGTAQFSGLTIRSL